MSKNQIGTNLTEGPILKALLIFALPIIFTNLIQQLYSVVDLIVIGQFVGNIGTVGVNTGGEMADLVTPVAMGFSTAGQIYIAQLYGAKQDEKIKRVVGTLLTFMMILSIGLCILSILFSKNILQLLNCPAEAFNQASMYMIITSLGFPFIFGYNAVVGILRGMGESKRPLIFIIIAAIINIVLDLILVIVFHMEAAGTAIATIASQFGSFAAAFYYMWKKRDKFDFEIKPSYFKMEKESLGILIKLGIPQVTRSMFVRFGMLWCNSTANSYGMLVSTTNSIGNKLQKFLEVFVQGVDTASASMVGQNLGAKKTERAGKTTISTVIVALGFAMISCCLALVFPRQIFGIFTSDTDVIELGVVFLSIFTIHFISSAVTGSFQAMVTGCGFVELGFILGILDGVICKVGLSILFINVFNMGYVGLWWGVATSRILNGIICIGYFLSNKWKYRKLLT